MWLRPRILTLIFLVSLFSTLISGNKREKTGIITVGFGAQTCNGIRIEAISLYDEGLKACRHQRRAEKCKMLGKCGLVKKIVYQKKYDGPPLRHQQGDHLMRRLFDVKYPEGENFNKVLYPDISICFNGFTPEAKQITYMRIYR